MDMTDDTESVCRFPFEIANVSSSLANWWHRNGQRCGSDQNVAHACEEEALLGTGPAIVLPWGRTRCEGRIHWLRDVSSSHP